MRYATVSSAIFAILVAALGVFLPCRGQSVPTAEPYTVVHGWPEFPDFATGQISGVAVDSHDQVFVFSRRENSVLAMPAPQWQSVAGVQARSIASAPVMVFAGRSGKLVSSWGEGQFVLPHGLAIDRADHVWVTDIALHQVFEFSPDGKLLLTLGARQVPGNDLAHFNGPTGVAFGPDGSVYISDGYGNSRVLKFSPQGKFLLQWGSKGSAPGEFNVVHAVAVDQQGQVYVADRDNARIQVFDGSGRFLREWHNEQLGKPWGVAVGPDNLIYTVYGGNADASKPDGPEAIVKSDRNGKLLARWSGFGNYDGQIVWGHDIAVGRDGAVYVGDVYHGMRIQKFLPR